MLAHTAEYLEVRWSDESKERIRTPDLESLLRIAHADSLGPDGRRTNLEILQSLEALDFVQRGIEERAKTIKSDRERNELDRLVRRIFAEGQCKWDARHSDELMGLLVAPLSVGFAFRVRERIHRMFCSIE